MANKNSILIDLSESDKTKFGKQAFATQSAPQQCFLRFGQLSLRSTTADFPSIS